MQTIADIIGTNLQISYAILWKNIEDKSHYSKTCMEVEVKKPNNRMMGSDEVYVEQ
jgi:hypothetical protein